MTKAERLEESERLKNLTKREVDFRVADCKCGEWVFCDLCSGSGSYHEAFYSFCDHPVIDGPDLECEESDCVERERLSVLMRRTDCLDPFPMAHAPLESLSEIQSRRDEELETVEA